MLSPSGVVSKVGSGSVGSLSAAFYSGLMESQSVLRRVCSTQSVMGELTRDLIGGSTVSMLPGLSGSMFLSDNQSVQS
jgi:hypothetical protein